MLAKLKKWWRSFDAYGRKSLPILGATHDMEQKSLAEAKRQQDDRSKVDNG